MPEHDSAGNQHQYEHSQRQEDRRSACYESEADSRSGRGNDGCPEHRPLSNSDPDCSGFDPPGGGQGSLETTSSSALFVMMAPATTSGC